MGKRCWSTRWIPLLCFGVIQAALGWAVAFCQERPPNIVLIMADDLGFGELGCYGQKIIRTPHLDQMARDGMRFTRFYAGNNVCAPSRCCLMTGKHPGHAAIRDNANPKGMEDLKAKYGWEFPGQIPLPASEKTIAEWLKGRGYRTGAMGKWGLGHVGTTGDPTRRGFDLFYGYYCQVHAHNHFPKFLWRNEVKEPLEGNDATLNGKQYSQDLFVKEALAFIYDHQKEPFFLYLPFIVPHLSLQVPEDSLREYDHIVEEDYKHTAYLKHPRPRAAYAAMVTRMDAGIGKILMQLEHLGLAENTVVMFLSDNGATYDRLGGSDSDFFDSAPGCRGRKGSMYEGGIRSPLLVQWKGKIRPSSTSDHLSAAWDIFPTIAEIVQKPLESQSVDGISFLPELLGKSSQAKHEFLYWESPGYAGQQAVRKGPWKATRQNLSPHHRKKEPQVVELYHLESDSDESEDVASQHPEIVKEMEAIMKREHVQSELFPFPALDAPRSSE